MKESYYRCKFKKALCASCFKYFPKDWVVRVVTGKGMEWICKECDKKSATE